MNVKVIIDSPYEEIDVEYIDFNEVLIKYDNQNPTYDFPTGEEALMAVINRTNYRNIRLHWRTVTMIDKIKKPVIHRGVKLEIFFTWNNYVFHTLYSFYSLTGKMTR